MEELFTAAKPTNKLWMVVKIENKIKIVILNICEVYLAVTSLLYHFFLTQNGKVC